LLALSPAQEFWTYSHVKRREIIEAERASGLVRTICTFINPKMAKDIFDTGEVSDNSGFIEDLKKINPNFNSDEYNDVIDSMS
jgi:hypothetical protein